MTPPLLDTGGASAESVTLALIVQKLDALTVTVKDAVSDHERRLRELEEASARLQERMTLWQLAQAGYSTVAAAIAAAIGRMT